MGGICWVFHVFSKTEYCFGNRRGARLPRPLCASWLKRRTPFRRVARLFGKALRLFAWKDSRWGSSLFSRFLEYFWFIFSILSVFYSAFWYILVCLHAITLFPLNGISVLICLLILYVFLYFLYFYVFLCEITFLPLHA